jgi:hypothetical protein
MDNKTVIESLNIFKGIENEKGLPLKFAYALGRNINSLEPIVKALDKARTAKIDGQQEYEDARKKVIEHHASRDIKTGQPIQRPGPNGPEYEFEDHAMLNADLKEMNEDHADAVAAIQSRVDEFTELLEQEVEDFKPYKINIKYIPVDADGNCKLSVMQLRYLMPFLDGEIDDIPEG